MFNIRGTWAKLNALIHSVEHVSEIMNSSESAKGCSFFKAMNGIFYVIEYNLSIIYGALNEIIKILCFENSN